MVKGWEGLEIKKEWELNTTDIPNWDLVRYFKFSKQDNPDFFDDNEIVFYKNVDDLVNKLTYYKENDDARVKIAQKGKKKYFKFFNSKIIARYLIEKTFDSKLKHKYIWEK